MSDLSPKAQEELEMVRKHARELGEHFDCVHIFTSRYDPAIEDGTVTIQFGLGDVFSRQAQIQTWLTRQDEYIRINARRDEEQE